MGAMKSGEIANAVEATMPTQYVLSQPMLRMLIDLAVYATETSAAGDRRRHRIVYIWVEVTVQFG